MKFLLSIFLAAYFVVCYVNADECQDSLKKTAICFKKILYIGDENIELIRNESQLVNHCKEIKKAYMCVKKYGKCLRNFPKQVFTLFLRGAKTVIKDRCESSTGKKDFLKYAKCIRKPEIYDLNRCIDKTALELTFVEKNATTNQVIPAICCSFHSAVECLKQKANEYCLDVTGSKTAEYLSNIAYSFFRDIIDLSCGQRKSYSDCNRVEPEWMEMFKKIGKPYSSIKSQKYGIFPAVINNAKRIDS